MANLLELSSRVIDQGDPLAASGPLNRINHELSVISDDIAMVEAFSHAVVFRSSAGLVTFDTSGPASANRVVEAIRHWTDAPFHTIVYTHGHLDHVGGSAAFAADAAARGQRLRCVAHEAVPARFERYQLTNGYNLAINQRQFGSFRRRGYQMSGGEQFLPEDALRPGLTYRDRLPLEVGELRIELFHSRGETDDHSWAWLPDHRAICAGDFFIWAFPNAGNPQKVQRYPLEWARAMREMAGMGAELFLPAHGLPIGGQRRIHQVLTDVAEVLETLVRDTLERMNAGLPLDAIIHEVKVDPAMLEKPWLQPVYDEPEFVVRNIWRLYGGWYDGNPSRLKPAPDAVLARELAELCGGAAALARRAQAIAASGDFRLACHLAELATLAAPEDVDAHGIRAEIYQARRNEETSLMAKGIYGAAAVDSARRAGIDLPGS